MLDILDRWIEMKWDTRRWDLAMKTDKPVETYQTMIAELKSAESGPKINELSQAEQDWLRNSG